MTPLARRLALVLAAMAAPLSATAQSVLDRTPNLSGGWLGPRGTIQFNFTHRFTIGDPPSRKISNSPTFLFSYRLPVPVLLGANFATSSDVVPAKVNEWEIFGRWATPAGGPVDVALQFGYNSAAESLDGEVTLGRRAGRARVFAVGRYFTAGYGGAARTAVGGGAAVQLSRGVALAGDVVTLLDRISGEEVAFGAGLQLAVPYTPHTFSLQVTNANTATLEGASRGVDLWRAGFEFTIPFTLSRYLGRRKAAEDGAGPTGGWGVELRAMAFAPTRLEVEAGASVAFTNGDQVVHTVTATDGSWDSGPIEPGATWRRTFAQPGTYAFRCTPHPFMTGTIAVR